MSRRRHNEEIPRLTEILRETGYGWVLDTVRMIAFGVLIGGSFLLVYHVASSGLQQAFNQTPPQPVTH